MITAKSIYLPQVFRRSAEDFDPEISFVGKSALPFNLGREALKYILQKLSYKRISPLKILLPELICTDVPFVAQGLNVEITWYPVNLNTIREVLLSDDLLNNHDCLVLVNYFGMASSFNKDRFPNLIVIEDNAHGFLSRDQKGDLLGTRFDYGIFSLRKSLPCSQGALLYSPDLKMESKVFIDEPINKMKLRHLSQLMPLKFFHFLLKLKRRLVRRPESSLSTLAEQVHFPLTLLKNLDPNKERERRTKLYKDCAVLLEEFKGTIQPLSYNFNETPYGFVFFLVDFSKLSTIKRKIEREGLDLVRWPELPASIEKKIGPDHPYKNVFFIPFIW